ncbi:MAG TPA: zinc-dependent peptidase, partial [Bacteroidetes bacterium]|nr:zinc-dependent peptidase [Bacteroidota bacterium]
MLPLIIPFLVLILFFVIWNIRSKQQWKSPSENFPENWKRILEKFVAFYNALSPDEKVAFEYKIQEFLLNCRITGISTTIDDTDRVLVASSAIIPIFQFKEWRYNNIAEVLIYPDTFNQNFDTEGHGRQILGMVGTGYMNGKMILSKNALRDGFSNETDKKNTAIHEFVHLIDKMDGAIDGVPEILLQKQYTIPWLDLMKKKIDEIDINSSDINPYAATNKAEFFAVASEYFFERPKLLQQKHPDLYASLEKIFKQKMKYRGLFTRKKNIGRNEACP